MTTSTLTAEAIPAAGLQQRLATIGAGLLTLILASGLARRAAAGLPLLPGFHDGVLMVHVATVIPTIPLGVWLFARPKGTPAHRALGRIWAVLMLVTAFTSFGLHGLTGGFSWIHLLSIVVIVSVTRGVRFAMKGDIRRHRRSMVGAFTGITIAGFFTFLPGRLLGQWLLG